MDHPLASKAAGVTTATAAAAGPAQHGTCRHAPVPDRPASFCFSPAHCGGKRAGLLLNPNAQFTLAVRLRSGGVPIGEVFRFLSGLYFRGKVAYAAAAT